MRHRIVQGWDKPRLLNYLLLPVSLLYSSLISLRRWLYQVGIFPSTAVSVPVIVVGGVTAGGAGKTPVVIALIKHLVKQRYRPGVVSRGYGGKSPYWPREVSAETTAELVGDEPQLIFERVGVPVIVGPNRVDDAEMLIDRFGCDIIVSDDGFQHFAIRRDLDIVVVDGQSGLGNGWCLPSGPLRERNGLSRADLILINGPENHLQNIAARYESKCMAFCMELSDAIALDGGIKKNLGSFPDDPIIAIAGLGNPNRFFLQLEKLGLQITRKIFPDHHNYREKDLEDFQHKTILMTEKDAIKCRDLKSITNSWYVPGTANIEQRFYRRLDEKLRTF